MKRAFFLFGHNQKPKLLMCNQTCWFGLQLTLFLSFAKKEKGQAAITDAMFFLLVVAGLSTMLFLFSAGYGFEVLKASSREYQSTFATSALKTILYSSIPRNPEIPLNQATEVDYLLASVKEDFADDSVLSSDESLDPLRDNIVAIMEPFADNFDYLFYIYVPDTRQFPVMILYYSRWTETASGKDKRFVDILDPKEDTIVFCSPSSLDQIDLLLASVGTVYKSDSRMRLLEQKAGARGHNNFFAQASFAMWTTTKLPEGILSEQKLNCHTCSAKKTNVSGTYQWQKC